MMSECEDGICTELLREVRRRREQLFFQGMKAIRLELLLMAEQDRVRELECREWARLEEID
jgi:hypothetical protein